MNKLSRLTTLMLVSATLSCGALAAEKDKSKGKDNVVATVNGQGIPQAHYDLAIASMKARGAQESPELQNKVRSDLITQEILFQEAKKKGVEKRSDVQTQLELTRREILIRAFIADYLKTTPISDDVLKADYQKIKNQMGDTEYKARHVLLRTEDEAKGIIARLDKGEKFESLTSQSLDPGSKDKGGDLGWNSPNAYVKEFGDALVGLKKGSYTKTPVKTNFGYHVIQLDDTKALSLPPFEQAKPQLLERAQQMQVEKLIQELGSKAKIN